MTLFSLNLFPPRREHIWPYKGVVLFRFSSLFKSDFLLCNNNVNNKTIIMNIYYILKVSENNNSVRLILEWKFELKTQQVCSLIMVSLLAVVSANRQRINTKQQEDPLGFFQYVNVPAYLQYEFGFNRGSFDHQVSRQEQFNNGNFRSKVSDYYLLFNFDYVIYHISWLPYLCIG